MPRHYIERTTILGALERASHVPIDNRPLICSLFVRRDRHREVSLVCQAVGANGAEVRDLKVSSVALGQPTSSNAILNVDGEEAASGDDNDFFGRHA